MTQEELYDTLFNMNLCIYIVSIRPLQYTFCYGYSRAYN